MALLLTALLAGCAGGGGNDPPNGPTPADVDVDAASGRGAISGVVVDESIRPLADVAVELVAEGRNATTGEDGLFAFEDLEPGFYAMRASLPFFLSAQVTADVVAGQTAKVKVQLAADPAPRPYKTTYKHEGFMQVWGGIGQYEVENVGESGACDCRIYFQPDPGVSTFIFEATWEEPTPDPGGLAEYYWILEEPEGSMDEAGYCFSPCYARVSARQYSEGLVMARLDGPDAWVEAQQPFDLFVTVFYNGEAPDGWSFVAGDG
jgi:hypothetical protein